MSAILENGVGGLIGNVAFTVVTQVLSRIKHEIELARHHKQDLEELEKQLNELNELLKCSAKSLQPNKLLIAWLKKVNNAAYDADNLLDDCLYESFKHGSRTRKRDKSKSVISKPFHCHVNSHRVKNLTHIIKTIYADAKKLGVVPIDVAAGHSYDSGSSSEIQGKTLQDCREWVDNQGLVGRNQDITQLAELLCDSKNKCKDPTVIGIVGLPGLGKTALGKRVVKEKEVKRHFKSIFWLVASHSYDLTDILRKMAEQLDENVSDMQSHTIVKKLGSKLKGKSYLVVLDDVWDTFDWGPFKYALEDIGGSKGTTVLMTSRDKNVLAKMDTKFHASNDQYIHKAIMHQLKELNEDDSWDLFKQRLGGDNLASNSEKLDLGKRMVNKCGGIPLAIRALGDLLCNKNVEEWRCIEKNEEWNKEEHGILPSLKLSYIYLPNMALKKCFSYCAIFGEDEEIQKEKLIQLWMGQGFLQPYDNMERVGDEYVNILLNTSLFQEAKLDLVLSLARIVSGECWNLKEKTEVNVSSSTDFRHLSSPLSLTTKLSTAKFCENLRTYYNYCPRFLQQEFESLKLFLKHSTCLRVLCLQRLGLEDLPKSVGDLKHLRYLDISQNCFQSLPVVITKLYHLQVLRIDYNINCLNCSLHEFEVRFLTNLRHISAKAVDIGILDGMRHLTSLQTLSTINLKSNWGGKVIELRDLNSLRGTLGIKGLGNIITEEEARNLNLGNKLNVDRLFLEWSENLDANSHHNQIHHNQIFQHLEPHENLSMLDVAHYNGTIFPKWLMTMTVAGGSHRLSKLVSLKLRHCNLAQGELKLENLCSLRFLSLEFCYGLTISFPSNGFHCCSLLESLTLASCVNIGELEDMSPLTQLQYLEIRDCDSALYELKGLAGLPCLKEVITDRLLPQDLGRRSPLCKALQTLYLSTQAAGNSLPIQLQYLVALKELHINDFQSLEILPDWLGKLTSLSSLTLKCLPKLKQMPSTHAIQCLSNLKVFRFWECPLLEEQINRKHGEWSKIKHIPLSSFESN